MVDPRIVLERSLFPGEIARLEFISEAKKGVVIVHFDERGIYNAYYEKDLLVILPERTIFRNICKRFSRLSKEQLFDAFEVVVNFQKRNYEIAFQIALKNAKIGQLCMTDLKTFLEKKRGIK